MKDIPLIEKTKKTASMGDYLRAGSCTGEPQVNALNSLKSKDLTVFTDIVNDASSSCENGNAFPLPDDHWINAPLEEEDDKTLLMVAIENGLHHFIEVLLSAGASARCFNSELGKAPIHVAAQKGDLKALKYLFQNEKNLADVNAKLKSSGRTALHLTAEKKHQDCLNFLLSRKGIDVDTPDLKGGQTPLYLAIKAGAKPICIALIGAGASLERTVFDKSLLVHLKDKFPGLDPSKLTRTLPPLEKQFSESTLKAINEILENAALFSRYSQEDLERFESLLLQASPEELNSIDIGGYTLLQKSCERDIPEFVDLLLRVGSMDPNGTTDSARIPPLILAVRQGCLQSIQRLHKFDADFSAVAADTGETLLHCLLSQGNSKSVDKYKECLDYILHEEDLAKVIRKIINKRDHLENTALHYATQMWPQDTVRELLELGANIGMKNHWNDIPIHKIDPETMESFLDEFCLESRGDVNHENFEVTFNYSFLAPPKEDLPLVNREALFAINKKVANDPESQSLNQDSLGSDEKIPLPETLSLWYMGQSKEHRHLLKHPVVTSFLYLKWGKIRRNFNRNLRFYLLFVFVLTWYIFESYGGLGIRGAGKDNNSIPFFHILFACFALIMLLFVLRDWIMDIKEVLKSMQYKLKNRDGDNDETSTGKLFLALALTNWVEIVFLIFIGFIVFGANTKGILWTSLLILTILLLIREFFQVTVSLKRYLLSLENWIEVGVIVLTGVILFNTSGVEETSSYDTSRHLSAVVIVLSWAELITLVGKHPKLTRYNIYVMMFYKVMGTFFFFLCWYTFFIIAFGLGFYIMLHKDGPSHNRTAGEDDYIFFNSPWLALVKTSTMFVGELEFSDIPINLESPLSPLAYIFFLSFVFLIVVVLMNLLNGLAVSDTGLIQEQAEIVSYISRVETISYTESILLGDPFNFLSNWPALKWLANIPSCSFCRQLYRHRSFQRLFHKITGATGILLFYNFLPDKRLTLQPNQKRRECNFLHVELMDDDIIASVKNVVLKKRQEHNQIRLEERIAGIEEKLNLLLEKF